MVCSVSILRASINAMAICCESNQAVDYLQACPSFKPFLIAVYNKINKVISNIYSSNLCILDSKRVCTKNLLELAEVPPTFRIEIEEGMDEKIIGYARVSSREQAENTNALEQQIARLKEAGANYIFSDIEKGKKDDRPQYQELMRLVEAGKIQALIITRIDRITRSLPTLRKLVEVLQKFDVNLIILDQKLDLSTPQGKLMLNMLGVLAEWEVDLLSDRIKRGKEHQRKNAWANSSSPFGYLVLDYKYVLDQTPFLCLLIDRPLNYQDFYAPEFDEVSVYELPNRTVAQVARDCVEIFLQAKGFTPALKKIFDRYGVRKTRAKSNGTDRVLHWTRTGFSKWIQNPVLDGHTAYGKQEQTVDGRRRNKPSEEWHILPNTHPDQRLLKDGEAEEIRRTIEVNTQLCSGAFGSKYYQDGYRPYAYQIKLIYCGECGSRAVPKGIYASNNQYRYYGCRHSGVGCGNSKNIKQGDIEASLIEALLDKAMQLDQGGEDSIEQAPFKTERLQKLEMQLAFLEQFPGFNPNAEQLKVDLQRQIAEETNFFQSQHLEDKTVEEIIRAGSNLGVWQTLSSDEKVKIYRRIVHKIFIRNGRVESIVFKHTSSAKLENADGCD